MKLDGGMIGSQIKYSGTGIASAACIELKEEASQAEQGDHYGWCSTVWLSV